jgi:hypothetical protein
MSRKNRRHRRKNQMGGAYSARDLNLAQGREYNEIHANQRGGGSWSGAGAGAPLEYDGRLPSDLVASARVGPTLQALSDISGMKDVETPMAPQTGGRRRKASRKGSRKASRKDSRKASRKVSRKVSRKGSRKASRKVSRKGSRKASRKNTRRQRGGAYAPAPYNAPTMLLTPAQAAKAGTADFSNPLLKH